MAASTNELHLGSGLFYRLSGTYMEPLMQSCTDRHSSNDNSLLASRFSMVWAVSFTEAGRDCSRGQGTSQTRTNGGVEGRSATVGGSLHPSSGKHGQCDPLWSTEKQRQWGNALMLKTTGRQEIKIYRLVMPERKENGVKLCLLYFIYMFTSHLACR